MRISQGILFILPLGMVPAAMAVDFVAVNTAPVPDTLVAFDSDDPAGVDVGNPVAVLAGDFIRGLDLDGHDDGWYVITATTPGTPGTVGLHRLDDGASIFINPLPFESTAIGGLSLSADETFLYWVSDPPADESPNDDTLYRIDFDGTVTELAEITLAGTDPIAINGLAVHPKSGAIYALETSTDQLITIDPQTGAAAAVGLTNVAVGAVGGLDFTPEGQLFGQTAFGEIYELDPASGAAGALLGDLGLNASAIAFRPPACHADLTGDKAVNVFDLLELLGDWGACADPTPGNCPADLAPAGGGDGTVNVFDLLELLSGWGACP